MALCFTIIRNLAGTTRVFVKNGRADLFLKGIFITEQRTQVTYYGKTHRNLFTRATEHMGLSNLSRKRIKIVK